MLRAFNLLIILFSLTILVAVQTFPTSANSQFIKTNSEEEVVKVSTSLINLPVVVSDQGGRYVPNLKAKDFTIYENGVKQEIDLFSTVSLPFHVVLLIDASGSVENNFTSIRNAAHEFVNNIRKDDKVMIVSFSDRVIHNMEFTSDKGKLNKAIDKIFYGGSTRFNDAVYHVSHDILKNIPGRKALVMLTDGQDTTSSKSTEAATRELEESGALVYVVSYLSDLMLKHYDDYATRPKIGNSVQDPRFNRGNQRSNHSLPPRGNGNNHNPPHHTPDRNNIPKLPAGTGKGGKRFISQNQQANPFVNVGYQIKDLHTPALDYMVQNTDAIRFKADTLESLVEPMKMIAEQLRYVYSLSYYSTNPIEQGGFRKVEVKLLNKENSKLQYKRGYNATAAKPATTAY